MSKLFDLSILIPARNEMFLQRTIEDILAHIEGKTEIIVVLDGQWPEPGLPQYDNVTIIYNDVSIGQRAATNQAARLSTAKYVMKVDAHCAFDQGFDVKMMSKMQDDWTMVPTMRNLHVFDWVCEQCGDTRYQGPTPTFCLNCDNTDKFKMDVVWIAKRSPQSSFFRFDHTLHFQYWNDLGKREENRGEIAETMSIQGSCFMMTREKYWELDVCDEAHGSWGQQGVEVACKTWLSGGRVVVNKLTWYAHMFRTQGGDFGFPYPLSNTEVEKARQYSRDLFIGNNWPKAIHNLQWLIDKFNPPDWVSTKQNKGIIYYTDNQLNLKIAHKVQKQLLTIGLPIVSASLKPMPHFGQNIHLPLKRGYLAMFKQILAALEASTAEIIYFCEHDVIYHPSHFDFTPPTKDKFYYNENFWKVRIEDGHAVHYDAKQVSGLVAYRELLIKEYRKRVTDVERDGYDRRTGFEPGTHDDRAVRYFSEQPNVDIRHDHNLTKNRWSEDLFRNKPVNWIEADEVPGWGRITI